ncbi:MAG: hypothetical protein WD080_07930, partial [Egibacteraceae bacterium]
MTRHTWLRRLGWDGVPVVHVPALQPLSEAQVGDVAAQLWFAQQRQPNPAQTRALVRISGGDPLLVRLTAGDLLAGRVGVEELSRRTPGLPAYVEDALTGAPPAVRALLGCCA